MDADRAAAGRDPRHQRRVGAATLHAAVLQAVRDQAGGEGRHPAQAAQRGGGGAVRVQPPHAAGPRDNFAGAQAVRACRHVLHLQGVGGAVAHAHRGAAPRPRPGLRQNAQAAGARRAHAVPRGHHLPRALPAALLRALRRAQHAHRACGHDHEHDHVPRHHGARQQGHGPLLRLHEPAPRLQSPLPARAPRRADLCRRQVVFRGRQLHAAPARWRARLRVHRFHPQGQVPPARRHRRHRVRAQAPVNVIPPPAGSVVLSVPSSIFCAMRLALTSGLRSIATPPRHCAYGYRVASRVACCTNCHMLWCAM